MGFSWHSRELMVVTMIIRAVRLFTDYEIGK